jgi:hypothetical protein
MNPSTHAVLQDILLDPQQVVITLLIMLIVPVNAGMILRATRPDTGGEIRTGTRRISALVFAVRETRPRQAEVPREAGRFTRLIRPGSGRTAGAAHVDGNLLESLLENFRDHERKRKAWVVFPILDHDDCLTMSDATRSASRLAVAVTSFSQFPNQVLHV